MFNNETLDSYVKYAQDNMDTNKTFLVTRRVVIWYDFLCDDGEGLHENVGAQPRQNAVKWTTTALQSQKAVYAYL